MTEKEYMQFIVKYAYEHDDDYVNWTLVDYCKNKLKETER